MFSIRSPSSHLGPATSDFGRVTDYGRRGTWARLPQAFLMGPGEIFKSAHDSPVNGMGSNYLPNVRQIHIESLLSMMGMHS